MTQSRRGRRGSRGRAPRRVARWIDQFINLNVSTGGQITENLTVNLADAEKKGATLVRTIIDLEMNLSAPGSGGFVTLGATLVELDAIAAGAFPDVDISGEQPGWTFRMRKNVFTSSTNNHSESTQFIGDFKSKRTLRGLSFDYMLIIDAGVLTASVNIDGSVRTLWLMH